MVDPAYGHEGAAVNDGDGTLAAEAQGRRFGPLGTALVIIPTYNEAENIKTIVGRVREAVPEAHVLVADDNSPDGTGKLADELAAEDDQVQVLHRKGKEGLGAAYLAGFRWGLEHGYGVLIEMDADGSHQPEELPRLLTALKGADLVLGSRWVPGGRVVNWPKSREFISRGGSLYSRARCSTCRCGTSPAATGPSAARPSRAWASTRSPPRATASRSTWPAARSGPATTSSRCPITFVERELGDSKMSRDILVEALWRVTTWGVGGARGQGCRRRKGHDSHRAVRGAVVAHCPLIPR